MPKPDSYKVKVAIGDAHVEVEGPEAGVVKIVQALAAVLGGSRKPTEAVTATPGGPPDTPRSATTYVDIRSFFTQKHPGSDVEAAAVAAYFYKYVAPEPERLEAIDSQVLQNAFRMAKRRLPPKTIYTLVNARNAGYLDAVGAGAFKLNSVGYNLVEHTLGDDGASSDTSPKTRRSRRRK
jgi:hypothetical protein